MSEFTPGGEAEREQLLTRFREKMKSLIKARTNDTTLQMVTDVEKLKYEDAQLFEAYYRLLSDALLPNTADLEGKCRKLDETIQELQRSSLNDNNRSKYLEWISNRLGVIVINLPYLSNPLSPSDDGVLEDITAEMQIMRF